MPRSCSVAGCERVHYAKSYCKMHSKRVARHGDPLVVSPPGYAARPVIDRFWKKIDESGSVACWEWKPSLDSSGYGQLKIEGKMVYAHRWSYEYFVGPITKGLQIDHLCRNRRCVNPTHLEVVTPRVNWERGFSPSRVNGLADRCSHGHEFDLVRTNGHRDCSICRRERNKRTWARTKAAALVAAQA